MTLPPHTRGEVENRTRAILVTDIEGFKLDEGKFFTHTYNAAVGPSGQLIVRIEMIDIPERVQLIVESGCTGVIGHHLDIQENVIFAVTGTANDPIQHDRPYGFLNNGVQFDSGATISVPGTSLVQRVVGPYGAVTKRWMVNDTQSEMAVILTNLDPAASIFASLNIHVWREDSIT